VFGFVRSGGIVESDVLSILGCIGGAELDEGCCLLELVLEVFVVLFLFVLVV